MLSNSLQRLSMSQPKESPSTVTEKEDIQLKKIYEGTFYIKQQKPVERRNTIVTIRKIDKKVR